DRDTDEDGVFDEAGAISTIRVSISSSGIQGNDISRPSGISKDGRFVAFYSFANNLVVPDDNHWYQDVFVHDRDTDEDGVFDEAGAIS
ncbi:hypothetical protein C6A37_13015, partial [Desulfobacteraceae bacterium SEEP-SAG9]